MEIVFKSVEHLYKKGTPFEKRAIYDINTTVPSGLFLAVIGHTGSGKSTLMQHINGLLKPTSGTVTVGEMEIEAGKKKKNLKPLRKRVGMVFQYPEHQLFEETVEKDICFAPLNFGIDEKEAKRRAKEALKKVGLPEEALTKSPFDLSGGQKRRVAIAGVLVMEPDIIVLDEPTAGLDPRGRKEIMSLFKELHKQLGITVILVTHSMEDAATYAEQIVIMQKGTIVASGTPTEIFKNLEVIQQSGLDIPESVRFLQQVEDKLEISIPDGVFTVEDVANVIENLIKRGEPL